MKINHVHAVYFSPTGNAKKVVTTLAQAIADTLSVPMDSYDFTLPESREKVHTYGADDLLVIGTPVYAGRIPNKMLPFVQTHLGEMARSPFRWLSSETVTSTMGSSSFAMN